MMGKLIKWLVLAFAIAGSSSPTLAATCATLSVSPATPTIPTWDPIQPALQEASFTATLNPVSSSTKRARLIFLDADSNVTPLRLQSPTGPRYEIVNTATGATISFPMNAQVISQTVPLTQFNNGNSPAVTIPMKVRIAANLNPVEDFVGGTTFAEPVRYSVQCFKANGTDNGSDTGVVSGLNVVLTIPRLARLTTASPVTINFGNFTTTTQQVQVALRSTSSLNVAVTTANGSKMVRVGTPAPFPANAVIPYTMRYNGNLIATGVPLTNQARAGVSGASFPLQLQLAGIPSGKLAGSYSDTITLTVTPGL
jgi:virulence-associated protein VagC